MKPKYTFSIAMVIVLASMTYQYSLAEDDFLKSMEKGFIRIVDDVSPAIAEISAIFTQFQTGASQSSRPDVATVRQNIGTGIIIDRRGYIVTTESVVGGANRIDVNLADGRDFVGQIIGLDPATDIALLKVNADDLPAAVLGDSDNLRAGSWVVTIGRSYGKSPTLSFGIVSGIEPLPGRPAYYDAIKINAAASPGNSGGGVVDMDGKVVGIITATLAEPRAIDLSTLMPESSIAELRAALERAKASERLAKADLYKAKAELDLNKSKLENGLLTSLQLMDSQKKYMSAQSQYDMALADFEPLLSQISATYGSTSQEIDRLRNQILQMQKHFDREWKDNVNVEEMEQISRQWEQEQKERQDNISSLLTNLQGNEAGSNTYSLRGRFLSGREASFATPINFAKAVIDDLMRDGKVGRGWLGIVIRGVEQSDMKRLGLDTRSGAIVVKVNGSSPAHNAGIQKDDIIIEFGQNKIKNPTDLMRILADTKPHTDAKLTIIRGIEKQVLTVKIGETPK